MIEGRSRFGTELAQLRRGAAVSRTALADRAAPLSKGYLALLEQGHRRPSTNVVDRLADALRLDATDRSRLRVRAVLDRFEDAMPELRASDLGVIEAVADALLLFSGIDDLDELTEALPIGAGEELRLKAARHISHVLSRVAERWRSTELLTMPDYFRAIIAAMDAEELSTVTAVNTIDPRRWVEDQREVRYLEANERAAQRGVRIRRLFIVGPSARKRDLSHVAHAHERAGVYDVRWLSRQEVSELTDAPEDVVLFDDASNRMMYIGHADPEDAVRVEFGERLTNEAEISRFSQYFEVLYASARARTA